MIEKLRVEHVIAEKDGIKLLNGFHMTIEEGISLGLYVKESKVKSVIVDILEGVHKPLNGYYFLDDKRVDNLSRNQRIHVVEGNCKLIDGMSIANNIFVMRSGFREQIISSKMLNEQTSMLLNELSIELDPRLKINELTAYEKVQIELAKAYGLGFDIVVLKDLSAYYSDDELDHLKSLMNYMKAKGKSFIILDSFYDVLKDFCKETIWVKDGVSKWLIANQVPEAFYDELNLEDIEERRYNHDEIPVLQFSNVTIDDDLVLNMSIYKGEIVNVFDKTGSHLNVLKSIVFGESKQGSICLNKKRIHIKSLDHAIDMGIGYIGNNPINQSLFPDLTCLDNLSYIVSRKVKHFWMMNSYKRSILHTYMNCFDDIDASKYIDELKISDKQRLVYYRWIAYNPKVMLIERPFTSVDQTLRQLTYDLINELAKQGVAVILLTVNKAEMFTGRYFDLTSKENTPFSKE